MTRTQQVLLFLTYILAGVSWITTVGILVVNPGGSGQASTHVMIFWLPFGGLLAGLAGLLTIVWNHSSSEVLYAGAKRAGVFMLIEGTTLVFTSLAWYVFSKPLPQLPFITLIVGQLVLLLALALLAIRPTRVPRSNA